MTTDTANHFDAADLEALVDTVRRFALERVRPNLDAWEAAGEIPRALYREAADLGLLGLGYPEHLGGTPAPWRARNALSQTLARHGTSGGLKIARKHVAWYSKGLFGSADFRTRINQIDDPKQVTTAIRDFYEPQIERLAA